jgi:hypothetical protein
MFANHPSSHEQSVAAVVQQAEASLGPILNELGTILYSSCATLKRGKYYFLGLNPGGGSEGTIRQSLDELALGKPTENAYLDQDWSSPKRTYARGEYPYQQDFKCLFKGLGEEPRDVCATNLIFKGSADARGAGYPKLAKPCWPVHEAIIRIVQPEAIITFGVQAFEFVAQQRGGQSVQFSSRHGYWSWQHSILADGKKLIGTRHPSRYALRKNQAVVDEIKKFLGLV